VKKILLITLFNKQTPTTSDFSAHRTVDFDSIIELFASRKARKAPVF